MAQAAAAFQLSGPGLLRVTMQPGPLIGRILTMRIGILGAGKIGPTARVRGKLVIDAVNPAAQLYHRDLPQREALAPLTGS